MFQQLRTETQIKHLDAFLELISTFIKILIMSKKKKKKKVYIEIGS